MATVGILSMQRIANYGSFLQAYGLKQILEELGYEVVFVDYHIEKPLIEADDENYRGLRRKIYKAIEALQYNAPLKHRIQFMIYKKGFASKYHKILGIKEQMNYTPLIDALVIGSDEVFNCIQKNTNVGYSLELFGKNHRAQLLISYAASFGNTTLKKIKQHRKEQEIGHYLRQFQGISVRDKNSGDIVQSLTGRMPLFHLDPVLIYDYIGCCKEVPQININEKYLILYAYSGRISKDEAEYIAKYAKMQGLKIYAIGGVQKYADRFIDCSPFEVLGYFLKAQAVITDTFHGSIFSIITKRPFATLIRKSQGDTYGNEEKLTDLLARLSLRQQIARNIEEVRYILEQSIDYDQVEAIIKAEREKTYAYLRTELMQVNQNCQYAEAVRI